MIGYVPVEDGHAALAHQMADPAIRIVSLTVTEGGYYVDPVTGQCDLSHPDLLHDVAHPDHPKTAFGAIVRALRRRRAVGQKPFTCLSCDNLQGNGAILRQTIVGLAGQSDEDLAGWIAENGAFPNSMVDCIVPATGQKEIDQALRFGIVDAAPVTHENFRQWVIEDNFCEGRPDWDKVGATFVTDVDDYEMQKIRLLNAGHQVIANCAEILGIETVSEAMRHAEIRALFRKITLHEIAPHVPHVPNMSPARYVDLVEERFSNPTIVDTIRRVAFDGSSRHPGFVLPTVRDAVAKGASVHGLALVQAAWACMCAGVREDGTLIAPNDPFWDALVASADEARDVPQRWLMQEHLYGDLAQDPVFSKSFGRWLKMIYKNGIVSAIQHYLKGD
jgi:mannitol 2-dehydrogenase